MASLAEGYCSLITRASQFSSTTRNLVPRFRSGSKGEGIWLRNAIGSSQSWLFFSKRSIHSVDVFIPMHHYIMMRLSSFLKELHRTYERVRKENPIGRILTRSSIRRLTQGKKHRYLSN